MHSLLDTYLEEVAGHLAGLPTARRADELREVRIHLENAVIVGREMGQTEDEAMRDALVQFGTPQGLGENIVGAWARGERQRRQKLWGTTAGALVLMSTLPWMTMLVTMCLLLVPSVQALRLTHNWVNLAILIFVCQVLTAPTWWLIGTVLGWLAPKTAVAGIGYAAGIMFALMAGQQFLWALFGLFNWPTYLPFIDQGYRGPFKDWVPCLIVGVLLVLVTVQGARLFSRKRAADSGAKGGRDAQLA